MRVCCATQKSRWVVVAILGVPRPVGGTLPNEPNDTPVDCSGGPPKSSLTGLSVTRESRSNAVAEGDASHYGQPNTTLVTLQGPSEWDWVEPAFVKADSRELLVQDCPEPKVEVSGEPSIRPFLFEAWYETVKEPFWEPLPEVRQEPLVPVSARASVDSELELLIEAWPQCVKKSPYEILIEPSRDPLMGQLEEASLELVGEVFGEPAEASSELMVGVSMESLKEVSMEPLVEAAVEPLVETCPAPSGKPGARPSLVLRVLDECLEMEKDLRPALRPDEEEEVVRWAETDILQELRNRKTTADMSISEFEACSWRWLKLVLLMREWQDKGGSFKEVISTLDNLVSRPVGLSDIWFLAGMVQRFVSSMSFSRVLHRTLMPHSGWDCRRMIYREGFPDTIVRLPESEECVNRVSASSKLEWWLRQAERNIRIDEDTWTVPRHLASLFRVQRVLGKPTFDDAIEAMKYRIPPPSYAKLSNRQYLACLLKYVKTDMSKNVHRTKPCRDPQASSTDPVEEMRTFVAGMVEECSRNDKIEERSSTMKKYIAGYALRSFQAVLSRKRDKGYRIRNPFNSCGWRWLSLAGLMNDYLEPELVTELISDSEMVVPRPKHVSPLWYLACRMQACLKGTDIARIFNGDPPSWWISNTVIYQDSFPQTFGELPMSERSAQLIGFSSKAAHWIASGIRRFHTTNRTWSPTPYFNIVDRFQAVLGDIKFNEMINLIKPRFSTIARAQHKMCNLSDKAIAEVILRYAGVARRESIRFCKAWQTGNLEKTDTNSSVDEPLAKEPPAKEPPAKEPPAKEPPAKEPPAKEPPAKEPPAKKKRDG
ncbi:hypothetical protein GNI_012140 [Gregarina niphandrodes]|uniref:Uncharacterized protein n=1 Tax=Gregarina niphandrodes TaxID=110365 RepID=A0A023BCL9_GRENI|nr:hypothetical protein GNI_012140 [Gregarina niphandrodes]EZG85054.1 hypothetical protein GNI_012140 [Gregarina niphandrodes]|eukprot:XP_011128847.1 hypothetical protein GNI_012140 [Gregarina niphandrodes]